MTEDNRTDRHHFESRTQLLAWHQSREWRTYSLDKSETELSCLAYYLHAFIQSPHRSVDWPIAIQKSESPDFTIQVGTATIGLEHSTITSTKYQQFRAESLRSHQQRIVSLDTFKIGGAPREAYNSGWVGNEAEREWAELAYRAILNKLTKLNRPHFRKFDRNELILNTVSYLPNLDMSLATELLAGRLVSLDFAFGFDTISFIYGNDTFLDKLAVGLKR